MPTYDRHCDVCDELFDVFCKIAEKDNTHECPYCGSITGNWRMSAPAVSTQHSRFINTDKRTGFGDVVKKIAKTYPKSELAKRV